MSEFLSFDTFIAPKIIRIVFVLGLLLIALGTLIRVLWGIWSFSILSGVIMPLIAACIVALMWRIYCELILVFFDMRDKLADIAARPRV
ncbi:MAG TPA: DUF4282 domain-containing protein [Acetobacteraceae bacterium]|jgi:hypothetical protein|nr:DUF4282 domain-containing protein [Acetobacteraceae bacterium]